MLKKENSLPSFCFKKVYQKGKTKRGKFVVLKFLENNKQFSRFGIVAPSKIIKKATKRNLIKRRAKEIIGSFFPEIEPGFDFICIIKEEASFKDLKEEIKDLFPKGEPSAKCLKR